MNLIEQAQAEDARLQREIKHACLTVDAGRLEEEITRLCQESKRRLHAMTVQELTLSNL